MLSPEEIKIAEYGKAQGKTKEQVAEAISKYRVTQTVQAKAPEKKQGILSRIGSDIKQRGENVYNEITNSSQNPVLSGIKATSESFGGISDVVGEVINSIPVVRDVAKFTGDKIKQGFNATTNKIADTKLFREASQYPEQTKILEDFLQGGGSISEIANNILLAKGVSDTATGLSKTVKTGFNKTVQSATEIKKTLTPTPEQIALERQAKMTKGLNEQNVRLKSADKAFNKNTINRSTPDGKKVTITPIDTFVKNDIAPVIEKGSIQMGDYKTGAGELGKIKTKVANLDTQIEAKMKGNTTPIDLNEMEYRAFEKVMKNEDFRLSGTVGSNVAKLEAKFKDFRNTYGDKITAEEVNKMRKNANYDFDPETQDISRIIGDTSRDYVYKASPDAQKLLLEQGELLSAKKYAEAINGTKVTGGRLGNMALRTAGAIAGTTIKDLPVIGPIIGAIGGEFIARALQQAQFKSLWTELRALLAKPDQI
jgi:hypothetical protein